MDVGGCQEIINARFTEIAESVSGKGGVMLLVVGVEIEVSVGTP